MPPVEGRTHLSRRDTMLYALGIGATELAFVYEQNLQALPTMAAVLGSPGFVWRSPEFALDWTRVLHGETSLHLHAPLPVEGEVRGETTFGPIFDKGADKGAVIYTTRRIFDETGVHVATLGGAIFARGDGGFGGTSEGQPKPHTLPDRPADLTHDLTTAENQALIYRLSGDYNPLHADPAVAQAAGFPRPILHGLCSYGVAGRSVLATLCGNDPARLKRLNVRFTSPVFPGETIRTEIWRDGEGRASFRALVAKRDAVVLNNGYAEFA
jgi:acyl dehydratase